MPAIASAAISGAGLLANLFGSKKSSAQKQSEAASAQASQAQAAEIKRRTELSKFLEGLFKNRLSTGQGATTLDELLGAYGMSSLKDLPGANNMGDLLAYGRLNRAAMGRNLMGLTGAVGSDILAQQGQQNFLSDAQRNQDLIGSAEALADSVLGLYQDKVQTIPEPVKAVDLTGGAPGVTVTPQGPVMDPTF
jgi:hypothetical protein